jgi:hypothetical protein
VGLVGESKDLNICIYFCLALARDGEKTEGREEIKVGKKLRSGKILWIIHPDIGPGSKDGDKLGRRCRKY